MNEDSSRVAGSRAGYTPARTGTDRAEQLPTRTYGSTRSSPVADRIPIEALKAEVPAVPWDRLQGSGVTVAQSDANHLDRLWSEHVAATPYLFPGEETASGPARPAPGRTYEEGGLARVLVNRYERDRAARAACIAIHGTTCLVCGFSFEQRYGKIGRDFIHVHHVRELSTLGPSYQVNPKTDLIPLCANCHAMAHRSTPALTPTQLRQRLRRG